MKPAKLTLTIILVFFIILLSSIASAQIWVKDHNNCPTSYQSQDCTGSERACGFTGGILYCNDSSTVNAALPGISTTTETANYNGALGGGYVLDCVKSATTCTPWVCQRDSSCFSVNRNTSCTGGTTTFTCGACISGYTYCDGKFIDGNGCEVEIDVTDYDNGFVVISEAHFNATCGGECDAGYHDCNADLSFPFGNGCEIQDGAACTVDSLPGTYSGCSGSLGNCVLAPQHHITGQEANYSSTLPNLWSVQYGMGWLMNLTSADKASTLGVNNDGCIVFNDSSTQCTASSGGYWDRTGTDTYLANSGDYVGIGTSSPSAKLDVEVSSGGAATIGHSSNSAQGNYAVAMGYSANASSSRSMAFGEDVEASGDFSLAAGRQSKASGTVSTAVGYQTEASGLYSFASGDGSKANNSRSTALGSNTLASGISSSALGGGTKALGDSSFAGGFAAYAVGHKSVALGDNSKAYGSSSVALSNSIAAGSYSTAFGRGSAYGDYSIAGGYYSNASGDYSFAGGDRSNATGLKSFAFGEDVLAGSSYAVAFGSDSYAAGSSSFAAGTSSYADGWGSVAIGWHPSASGQGATAIGYGTYAEGLGATALGRETNASDDYAFAAGYGSNASGIGSVALGQSNSAGSTGSIAMGYLADASSTRSIAIGTDVRTQGTNAIALGENINVSGTNSLGIGLTTGNSYSVSANNVMSVMGGKVGIGTVSPNQELEVSGDINASGTVYAGAFSSNSPLILQTGGITRMTIDDLTGDIDIDGNLTLGAIKLSSNCADGQVLKWSGGVGTCGTDNTGAGGGMNSFTLTGDSGTPETISDGNTVDIAGGTGIDTVVGATDTVTVNADTTYLQRRVSSCTAGNSIREIAVDGTVTCEADDEGINGSGTASYIPKFSDSDTLTDSVVYEASGRIGIGSTSPASTLSVGGNGFANTGVYGTGTDYGVYGVGAIAGGRFVNTDTNGIDSGVFGLASGSGGTTHQGVYGQASGAASVNFGVKGFVPDSNTPDNYGLQGVVTNTQGTNNYGVYGLASGGSNNNWGGYFVGDGYFSGNVGIGTNTPDNELQVVGDINASGTVYASAFSSNSPLVLQTGGVTRMTINDSSGDVDIGGDVEVASLNAISTTEQLRLTHTDGSIYSSLTTDASGYLRINPTGDLVDIGADNSDVDLIIDDGGLTVSSSAVAPSRPADGNVEIEDGSVCIGDGGCDPLAGDGTLSVSGTASLPGLQFTVSAEQSVSSPASCPGVNSITLGSTSDRFCYITYTSINGIGGDSESGTCLITSSGGNWELRAGCSDVFGDTGAAATCGARCVTFT